MITARQTAIESHPYQESLGMLLEMTGFGPELRELAERQINELMADDEEGYERLNEWLWSNQRDRISSGDSYNQGDILKHLRKLK